MGAMRLGDDDHERDHVAAAAAAGGGGGGGRGKLGNMILPQPSTDFRKAGAIPFKWEIQPGIPKPTYKTHHDQTLLLISSPLKQDDDHDHHQQAAPQKLNPAALRPPPSDHQRANYQPHLQQLGLITPPNPKLSSSSSSTGANYFTTPPNSRRHRWSNSPAASSTDHPMPADHLRMSSRVVSLRICLPTFRSFRKRLGFFTSIGRTLTNSSRPPPSTNTTPSTVISKATFETVSEIGSPVLVRNSCSSNSVPVAVMAPKNMMFLQQAQEQQPPNGRCSSSITSHGRDDQEYYSDHHPRMLGYDLPTSRPFSSFREISAPAAGRFNEEEEAAGSDFSTNDRDYSNRRINRNDLEWAAYGLF